MSNNKGIPTIGVRGIQFRSRIEAQWAYIFEKLGWNSKISLYAGIKKTGDWLIKNKNKFIKNELNYLHKK